MDLLVYSLFCVYNVSSLQQVPHPIYYKLQYYNNYDALHKYFNYNRHCRQPDLLLTVRPTAHASNIGHKATKELLKSADSAMSFFG